MPCMYCEIDVVPQFADERGTIDLNPYIEDGVLVIEADSYYEKEHGEVRVPINHCPFCGERLAG